MKNTNKIKKKKYKFVSLADEFRAAFEKTVEGSLGIKVQSKIPKDSVLARNLDKALESQPYQMPIK